MNVLGQSAVRGNLASVTEEVSQNSSLPRVVMVALAIIVPLALIPVGIWGAGKLQECKRNYDQGQKNAELFKLMNDSYGGTRKAEFPYLQICLCTAGIFVFFASCVALKNWVNADSFPSNITHLNADGISKGLPGINDLIQSNGANVKNAPHVKGMIKFLNLPQCYLNETPLTKVSNLLPSFRNISALNGTVNAVYNGTLNQTDGIPTYQFNFRDIPKSINEYFKNFNLQDKFNFQGPSFDFSAYFNAKAIKTTVSDYYNDITVYVRNQICDFFSIENC